MVLAEGALEESCERLKTVQQETEEIKTDLQELCEIAEKSMYILIIMFFNEDYLHEISSSKYFSFE